MWLLLIFLVVTGHGLDALIYGLVLITHELAHAGMAAAHGLRMEGLVIYPFGAAAHIDRLTGANLGKEISIALAGPLNHLLLLGVGLLAERVLHPDPARMALFIGANVALLVTNLLPAMPLDGGRVFRALRAERAGLRKATREATRLSHAIAVCLALAGLVALSTGLTLGIDAMVVAVFLWIAASREEGHTRFALASGWVRRRGDLLRHKVLRTAGLVAHEKTPLGTVMAQFQPERYHRVLVVSTSMDLLGELTEVDLAHAFRLWGPDADVGRALHDHEGDGPAAKVR